MTIFKKNNWQVPSFYICALLFYPLVWSRLFTGRLIYWSELNLFTPGLIALLCCSLLLFNIQALFFFFSYRAAKLITVAFSFILLISLIQLIVCYNGQVNYLWSSVYWIAIPLFCAVNRLEVEKYLPFFIILLGLTTIIQSFYELSSGLILFGITGNLNWNACLIALAFPFICFCVYRYFSKYYKISLSVITALGIIAAVLIFHCESKAAILSIIIASCSIAVLFYWRKLPWIYWLRTGLFLAITGIVLLSVFKEHLFVIFKDDQRLFLWSAALNLIQQNLWFGCGSELFVSACAPHIPLDYYLGRLISYCHPHAHNHLLQFAATMGIPALIAWCSVISYVVVKNLRKAVGHGNWDLKLYLFAFILLFVHSMLDIIDLSWPLGCIFLILFGILLARVIEDSPRKEIKKTESISWLISGFYSSKICRVAGACLMVLLLNYLYFNLLSSLHFRNARIMIDKKNIKGAFSETEKSIAAKMTPQNIYLAANISLYDFKNPQECLKYLDMLDSLEIKNYVHNNLFRAVALCNTGKFNESLLYFVREQQNYPLSCVNLYYYRLILNKLGKKQQANAIDRRLRSLLELKGFTEAMLPVLLKDPSKDFRFRAFNENRKK